MTDIEAKALALVNEVQEFDCGVSIYHVHNAKLLRQALCRAIEQHEAFRQEVSDAVEEYYGEEYVAPWFAQFIIPAPKPDPLIEVLRSVGGDDRDYCDYDIYVKEIRAALEARGLEIREKNDD